MLSPINPDFFTDIQKLTFENNNIKLGYINFQVKSRITLTLNSPKNSILTFILFSIVSLLPAVGGRNHQVKVSDQSINITVPQIAPTGIHVSNVFKIVPLIVQGCAVRPLDTSHTNLCKLDYGNKCVRTILKGTISRDFLYPVFFINQFILVPLEMSMGRFIFFCFFIELLHF